MDYECIRKTTLKKIWLMEIEEQNNKNQRPNDACEKKSRRSKSLFKHCFLISKISAKRIHAEKLLVFLLLILFQHDQNYQFELTSKIMKVCKQILKNTSGWLRKRLEGVFNLWPSQPLTKISKLITSFKIVELKLKKKIEKRKRMRKEKNVKTYSCQFFPNCDFIKNIQGRLEETDCHCLP